MKILTMVAAESHIWSAPYLLVFLAIFSNIVMTDLVLFSYLFFLFFFVKRV